MKDGSHNGEMPVAKLHAPHHARWRNDTHSRPDAVVGTFVNGDIVIGKLSCVVDHLGYGKIKPAREGRVGFVLVGGWRVTLKQLSQLGIEPLVFQR